GDFVEIGPAEALKLRVGVGEQTALHQRVIGKVDAGNNVGDVKGDLLGFGEEVVGVSVEGQAANALNGDDFLGDDLCGIEEVEVELEFIFFRNELNAEFPFGK